MDKLNTLFLSTTLIVGSSFAYAETPGTNTYFTTPNATPTTDANDLLALAEEMETMEPEVTFTIPDAEVTNNIIETSAENTTKPEEPTEVASTEPEPLEEPEFDIAFTIPAPEDVFTSTRELEEPEPLTTADTPELASIPFEDPILEIEDITPAQPTKPHTTTKEHTLAQPTQNWTPVKKNTPTPQPTYNWAPIDDGGTAPNITISKTHKLAPTPKQDKFEIDEPIFASTEKPEFKEPLLIAADEDLEIDESVFTATTEEPESRKPLLIAETPRFRPAGKHDLKGLWTQVAVRPGNITDLDDPWYSGKQLYDFTPEGHVKNLVARGDDLPTDAKTLIRSSTGSTQFEFVNEKGLMKIKYTDGTEYKVLCTFCETESPSKVKTNMSDTTTSIQSGDVILSYLDEEDPKSILFRRLIRSQSEE